jgi:hypothetical protein
MTEPMVLLHRYPEAHRLGMVWLETLIAQMGLPLEIIRFCAGRVQQIEAFDYDEGDPEPFTARLWYWPEPLEEPMPPYMPIYAVDRQGTWHMLARETRMGGTG